MVWGQSTWWAHLKIYLNSSLMNGPGMGWAFFCSIGVEMYGFYSFCDGAMEIEKG